MEGFRRFSPINSKEIYLHGEIQKFFWKDLQAFMEIIKFSFGNPIIFPVELRGSLIKHNNPKIVKFLCFPQIETLQRYMCFSKSIQQLLRNDPVVHLDRSRDSFRWYLVAPYNNRSRSSSVRIHRLIWKDAKTALEFTQRLILRDPNAHLNALVFQFI